MKTKLPTIRTIVGKKTNSYGELKALYFGTDGKLYCEIFDEGCHHELKEGREAFGAEVKGKRSTDLTWFFND